VGFNRDKKLAFSKKRVIFWVDGYDSHVIYSLANA